MSFSIALILSALPGCSAHALSPMPSCRPRRQRHLAGLAVPNNLRVVMKHVSKPLLIPRHAKRQLLVPSPPKLEPRPNRNLIKCRNHILLIFISVFSFNFSSPLSDFRFQFSVFNFLLSALSPSLHHHLHPPS